MEKAFLIDVDRCTGCHSCTAACMLEHHLPEDQFWTRIESYEKGKFPGVRTFNIPTKRCMHCKEPGCMKVCSTGAIHKYEWGTVEIDQAKCNGCGYCMEGCPYHVPQMDKKTNKAVKCNMCIDTRMIEKGEEPACAKTCTMEAIRFGDRDELLNEAKAKKYKYVYGEKGLGGAHLFYVSNIIPIPDLGLPSSPSVPASVYLWKGPVRYLGWLGFLGALAASGYQYIAWRRKQLEGGKDERKEK